MAPSSKSPKSSDSDNASMYKYGVPPKSEKPVISRSDFSWAEFFDDHMWEIVFFLIVVTLCGMVLRHDYRSNKIFIDNGYEQKVDETDGSTIWVKVKDVKDIE